MFHKKTLAVAIAGIVALSLSSAALANGGSYAAPPAPKSDSAIYVGLGLGFGDTSWNDVKNITGVNGDIDDVGFAFHAYGGYQFNKYFAAELGYTHWAETDVNYFGGSESNIRTYAVDISGKMMVPVTMGIGVFAKLGAAYLHASETVSGNSKGALNVLYGAGLSYEVMPNLVANLSWTRYNGSAKLGDNYQPDADLYALGIMYKFPVALFG